MIDKRFILFKKLAKGGMAEIYLGKLIGEDGFERVCCFKRILPHYSSEKEFIEMFRDEAHIGKRLQHPNIVRVEGFEEVDGAYAIIMEFINGADLRSVMGTCETLKIRVPIPFAVQTIAEAARGLHYAHVKRDEISGRPLGIVHRDISPQNILVSFEGESKVTDFGIADADSKLTETKTGIVKGKFSYMSPEQISAEQVDARTDVFALSIILWEMVTGRRLFQADNEILIIQMVRDCLIPEDMKAFNPEINEDLEKIITKGLKKNLFDRYESAAAFEKDLRQYLYKHHPGYSSDNVGEFLQELMPERRTTLSQDIKELLSKKAVRKPIDVELPPEPPKPVYKAPPPPPKAPQTPNPFTVGSSLGSAPKKTEVKAPTQRAPSSESTRRTMIPGSGGTQRRQVSQNQGSHLNIIIIIAAVLALAVIGFVVFKPTKKKPEGLATWTIKTIPEITKIEVDGENPFPNTYNRSPAVLSKLAKGSHSVVISRPGFQTETLTMNLTGDKSVESSVILKQVEKMAPTKLSLAQDNAPVHFKMDNGLFEDKLHPDKSVSLNYVTFGKEHVLIITLADRSSFSCQFTPRAQTWDTPFFVVVDVELKKCSYPLSRN